MMTKEQLIVKIRGQRIKDISIAVVGERGKDVQTRPFIVQVIRLSNGVVLEFPPKCMGWYKPVTKVCAAPGCEKIFVPKRSDQRYCSTKCCDRIYQRRRRAEKKARRLKYE